MYHANTVLRRLYAGTLYLYDDICLLMLLKCIAIYGDSSIKSKKSVTTTRTLSGLQIAELGN